MKKIIRDKLIVRIPAQALSLEKNTQTVLSHLQSKVSEEIAEFAASDWQDPSELGDALEALKAIAHHANINWSDVETAADLKKAKLGGFEAGLIYDPNLDQTR